jgi:hypothetical protein
MNVEETEPFVMHMIAGYDVKAGKPIGRRYFGAGGSFVTEAEIVQEEEYEWMKQDGELDKDGLRKGTLGGEMFEIRAGFVEREKRSQLVVRITRNEMWQIPTEGK